MKTLLVFPKRPAITWLKRWDFAVSMLFVCMFLLTNPSAHGQTPNILNVDDTTSTPIPGAGHDYIHMLSETVNPANGSVSLRIELPTPKGRGITPFFSIDYDSDSVQHLTPGATPGFAIWASDGDTWESYNTTNAPGGWSFAVPSLYYNESQVTEGSLPNTYTCNIYSNYMFTDSSGGQHALNIGTELSLNAGTCTGGGGYPQGGDAQVQAALTGTPPDQYNPYAPPPFPVKVYTPDGTVYTFTGVSPSTNQYTALPSSVEDRNGNILNFIDYGPSGILVVDHLAVVDTAGRSVISSSGSSNGATETLTVGGLTYQIYWTTISANASVPSQWAGYSPGPAQNGPSGIDACINGFPTAMQDTQRAISQITLPNGQSYYFHYDNPYGLLSEIDYPTGAWVKYSWKPSDNFNELADYPGSETVSAPCQDQSCFPPPTMQVPVTNGCLYQYASPVVATREVGFTSGGTVAQTQTFTYSTSWGPTGTYDGTQWSQKTTSVVTTDNVRGGISATTNYTYTAFQIPSNNPLDPSIFPPLVPLESQIVYFDYNGNTLETVNKTWVNQYELGSVQTTPAGGSASNVTYGYANSPFSLVTAKNEYDYGAANPTRMTSTAYQQFAGAPGDLVDRPCLVVICSSGSSCTSSSANKLAETDYLYDGGTATCGAAGSASTSPVSGLPATTHDPTLFGPGSSTPRGNVTKQVSFSNSGASPTAAYTYDETGQIVSMTDPNNNQTQYAYADSPSGGNPYGNSNAYLTQITYPTVNGVTPTKSFSYNYSLGYLTQSKDENGQSTNYTYNSPPAGCSYPDGLDRLSEADYPDGGKTTYCYNDAALTTTTTTLQTPDPPKATVATMDGMGHTIETQLTTDPYATADTVLTTYDGEGNVFTVSNPYQTTGDSTYGLTTYTYDALNRRTLQVNPDQPPTSESWLYNGNTVTFTNEDGNSWQRTTDALGRLTGVVEPSPGTTANYTYDALNDLTSVAQGAESRSFTYDSLARLRTATNPESGTTTYTYDPDSNPITKTDARGITTTYAYDALNRVTGKTYSDSTYPVTYTYDTSTGPSPMNTIGRLTDEKRTVQTVTVTERAIDQYDAMGRVLSERQCFVGGCAGTAYTLTHSYDVAGNVILSNNGMSNAKAVTLGYGYDGAGRLQAATSSLNDGEHPEVLFQATQYSAIGLTQAGYALPSVGGTPAYSQTLSYDKRLRLTGETDAATNPTSGMPYSYAVSYDGAGNATAMNDSLMGAWSYTPDALNRLSTAVSSAGTYSGLTLTETYDAYGNRGNQVPSGTYGGPVPQPSLLTFNGNNNRADQWSYDAAGDVLYDLSNMYEYDAEGRQTGTLNSLSGLTGYVYDAEGRRAMKVVVTGWNTQNPTTTVENEYLLGLNGEQVSVLDGSGNWQWTNVYAGSKQLATYDSAGTHFALTDWLGSKRMELSVTAASTVSVGEQCTSLPFGDGLNCTGTDVNQLHFTGKERDAESGNDYFGARYYASSMGRFLSADDGESQDESDPQSWNLYSYVQNDPLTNTDPDGHDCVNASGASSGSILVQSTENAADCASGFTYVNGTVNPGSATYNGETGQLSYSISNYADGSGMAATVVNSEPASYSESLQYNTFGPPSAQTWTNGAGAVNTMGAVALTGASVVAPELLLEDTPLLSLGLGTEDLPGVLSKAASAVGNQGVKVASRDVAEQAAKKWVGEGARPITDRATGKVVGEVSADGTKVARFTSAETKGYINLVDKITGGNLHVRW